MKKEEIEKIMAKHASQLREIGWTAVPFSKEDIGFVVKYDKNTQFNYYYDDNAEIYKVSATIKSPKADYYELSSKANKLIGQTSVSVRTLCKFFDELMDDIVFEREYEVEKLDKNKFVVELLGKTNKAKGDAIGSAKLMYEIFGDEANELAERMLTTEEYLKFLQWKIDTKNLEF